jgi:hypothetical protein
VKNITFALIATSVLSFGFASTAQAGQGGIAAGAAITFGANRQVTNLAIAASAGKTTAAVGVRSVGATTNEAYAIGTGGTLKVNPFGTTTMAVQTQGNSNNTTTTTAPAPLFDASVDASLGTAQANQIGNIVVFDSGDGTITIGSGNSM